MAAKAFRDLSTAEELRDYLDRPLDHVRGSVFHYTSLEAVLCIYSQRTLRFSSFERTNDRAEAAFVSEETKKKHYLCLMRTMEDSYAMWAMYGTLSRPREGHELRDMSVKLEIPVPALKTFAEEQGLRMTGVAYTQLVRGADRHSYCCQTCENHRDIKPDPGILSGYIKDVAWKYEREMRVWSDREAVPVSEGFLDSIRVIPSPVLTVDLCQSALKDNAIYGDAGNLIRFTKNSYEGSYLAR